MPLSISSSNQRIPKAPYGKIWMGFLLCFLFIALVTEAFLYNKGHLKSVTDNKVLWGMQLDFLRQNRADIAVMGASRMALGFQVDHFEDMTGMSVANIAIDGSTPVPLLQYLAYQTSFDGMVLISLDENHLLGDWESSKAARWIDWYEDEFTGAEKYNPLVNKWILNVLQSRFILVSANCGFRLLERLNRPIYLQTTVDRSKRAYYREMLTPKELDEVRSQRLQVGRTGVDLYQSLPDIQKRWSEKLQALKQPIQTIQARGGRVVFIRFPMSGEYQELFDSAYPKNRFWDLIAGKTGAETFDFRDVPEFKMIVCPDGSHLNYEDAVRVTGFLAEIILSSAPFKNRDI